MLYMLVVYASHLCMPVESVGAYALTASRVRGAYDACTRPCALLLGRELATV